MSFFQLYGMLSGLKGAVLDFNRISAALLAILSSLCCSVVRYS